ncbi:MAG TPA: glycosyltransferase family 39 protein [Methylomirabilota bacterium]|nr:glycosyltransferase family 39 protein [Methylomirabilota bacterium]
MGVVPLIALRPLQNAPFVDDWTYAWSVEHLLETGEVRILDWSTSLNVVHVLWGALFCLPFGFSFSALRLSTWVASLLALLGLHSLLRALGASRRDALIGIALLGFYPIYFILSFSFMTDVPFLTAVTWFFWALVRACRTSAPGALVWPVLLASVAMGIRPVGIFLAGALCLTLVVHPNWKGDLARRLLFAVVPVLVVLLCLLLAREHLTEHRADLTWITNSPTWRMARLSQGLLRLHQWLGVNFALVVGTLGVALTPLALGTVSKESLRTAGPMVVVVGVGLLATVLVGWNAALPLEHGSTWSLHELAVAESLVGMPPDRRLPAWWPVGARVVTTLMLCLALAPVVRGGVAKDAMPLVWGIAGYFVLTAVLWFFHDRYVLPLLVMVVALRLGTRPLVRPKLALLGLSVFATVSMLGTWDHLQYNRALWNAVTSAQRMGIPQGELDGGYVVNGWLLYAHPEHALRTSTGDVRVPWINEGATQRYAIVNGVPLGARVLHTEGYRRLVAPSGALYLVDRVPGAP